MDGVSEGDGVMAGADTEDYALDQVIEAAENGQPWTFTRNGKPVAIVIGYTEFERMKDALESLSRLRRMAAILDGDK